MTITHKRQPLIFPYKLNGTLLSCVNEFKYLGVTITNDLKWSTHVHNIVKKANSRLGFLRRSLKFASVETRLTTYKTLIRPLLEYASEVWDPHVMYLERELERVQRLAVRFIFSSYRRLESPTQLCSQAGLPSLSSRRKTKRLKLIFMILNDLVFIDKASYITPHQSRISRNKHSRHIQEYRYNKECFKNSFFPRTIREWNSLPESMVACQDAEKLFSSLSVFLGI